MNNKCPVCGSEGKQFTNIPFMYECSKVECGTYFDRKGQRYAREIRGGLIKIKEEEDMSQVDIIMKEYTHEGLLEELARTSAKAISKKFNVAPSVITSVRKQYEITQEDIDNKRKELGIVVSPVGFGKKAVTVGTVEEKVEIEPELIGEIEPELLEELGLQHLINPEVIVDPTPAQVEEFFSEPPQEQKIPAISGNGRLYLNTDGNCTLTSDFVCMRGTCRDCPIMRDVDKFLSQELSLEPTSTKIIYCLVEEGSEFADEYKTLDEAADDIRQVYSLDDIRRVKLYKEVRTRTEVLFTMEVKVTTK